MSHVYDLIVVGGGAMGLATAYNAVTPYGAHPILDGDKVLVLEQCDFFTQKGSTAGASRQFRLQYSEDYMTRLVMASIPEWRFLQEQTVETLIDQVGSLWFGDPDIPTTEGGIQPAMDTMEQEGVPFQKLDKSMIEDWYRFRNLPDNYVGFFQDLGGIINVPATLRSLFNLAHDQGVHLKPHHDVTEIDGDDKEVRVVTDRGTFHGKKLVMTPGPFANELLNPMGFHLDLEIWDMVSCYFRKTAPDINYPTWFAFQKANEVNSNLYYGFPEADWSHPGFVRVCPDYPFDEPKRAQDRKQPTPDDFAGTIDFVKNHMTGLDPEPHFESTCLIALADSTREMILDTLPGHPNIVVYTAGWAAKFIPLIGKICAQLALTGRTDYDIQPFRITRRPNLLQRI